MGNKTFPSRKYREVRGKTYLCSELTPSKLSWVNVLGSSCCCKSFWGNLFLLIIEIACKVSSTWCLEVKENFQHWRRYSSCNQLSNPKAIAELLGFGKGPDRSLLLFSIYRNDQDVIFGILFNSQFSIVNSKPMSSLNSRKWQKQFLENRRIFKVTR